MVGVFGWKFARNVKEICRVRHSCLYVFLTIGINECVVLQQFVIVERFKKVSVIIYEANVVFYHRHFFCHLD